MSLEPGVLLNNRYRIESPLGSGGMGAVYLGHDNNLDVKVAVKENFFVSEESARQFEREARLLATLRHPSLPRVTDHFVIRGQGQYLVMDYVEGDDARRVLEQAQGPLEEAQVLPWARQVLEAVAYLHSRTPPVIHRDIKPGNIKITPGGRAVLVDFGLAKEYNPTQSTTVGAKAFTPGFAPPEQYGQGRTDVRTDVYALGATFYNLLTGKVPADGLRRAMEKEQLIPVRELNPRVSPQVAEAIERSVAVKPDNRFQDVEAFSRAMAAVPAAEPTVVASTKMREAIQPIAEPTRLGTPAAPARGRGWLVPVAIGGFALVALGVGAALVLGGGRGATPTEQVRPTPVGGVAVGQPSPTASEPPTAVPTPAPPQESPTPEFSPTPESSPTPAATPVGGGASGQIAYASDRFGVPQVFLMDVTGANVTQLTSLPDGACQPAWSPDGERLLVVSPCRQKADEYPNAAIYVLNADGSGITPLISKPGGVYDPDWSQNGIAFTYLENNQPSIWVARADGSNHVRISIGRARDSQPSWSPGGDKMALLNTSRAGSDTVFWIFSDGTFNGSNPDQVTRSQLADAPDWSPLGDLIAYMVDPHIWIVSWDAVGFGAVKLTTQGPNDDPDWSPDGQWITFETWRDAANHDIYIMTANGARPTRLTSDAAREFQPAWRP
jgi:Tol biopolymer transport system component